MNLKKELATEILRNRKLQNLTQKDLADKSGIMRPNISRIESGEYNASLDMIERIAKSMDMEVHIVFSKREGE